MYFNTDAQSAFTGDVRVNHEWLAFLASKKSTRCIICKKFMPRVPGDMVVVFTFEWHIHINCLGEAVEISMGIEKKLEEAKILKEEKEEKENNK